MPRRSYSRWDSEFSSFLASKTQNSLALLLSTWDERDGRHQMFDEMPHGRYLQSLPELPPPPPPFLAPFKTQQSSSSSGNGINPNIIIIALILVLVFLVSASLHFILRHIDRVRHPPYVLPTTSPPSPSNTHQPLVEQQRHAVSSDPGQALVDSLPSLSFDSIAAFQKSSAPDCAVCLSRFESGDQLRFLPACCHVFHARCIDAWLASNRTCPLCRSTIHVPFDSAKTSFSGNGSESFRIEVGSVSRRRSSESVAGSRRSYSMGSFDYIIDDDFAAEVVVPAAGHARGLSSGRSKEHTEPAEPGADVAEAAGGGRGWLRDYVDRLTASASASSSRAMSFRLMGSGGGGSSRRSEVGSGGGGGSWDVGDEAGSFFRWLAGV